MRIFNILVYAVIKNRVQWERPVGSLVSLVISQLWRTVCYPIHTFTSKGLTFLFEKVHSHLILHYEKNKIGKTYRNYFKELLTTLQKLCELWIFFTYLCRKFKLKFVNFLLSMLRTSFWTILSYLLLKILSKIKHILPLVYFNFYNFNCWSLRLKSPFLTSKTHLL